MTRNLIIAGVLGLMSATIVVADDDKKPGPLAGKIDRAKLFDKLDADGNGKLTKEEFTKFREQIQERLKSAGKEPKFGGAGGAIGDKLFEKLDTNGDGTISKAEFEKFEAPAAIKGKLDPEKLKKLKEKKAEK